MHEAFVNISGELLMETPSLSVSVDLMNPTEVERLRQGLRLWTRRMNELEILFKVCTFKFKCLCHCLTY